MTPEQNSSFPGNRPNKDRGRRGRAGESGAGQQAPAPRPRNDLPSESRSDWLKKRWLLLGDWRGVPLPHPGRKAKHVSDVLDQILREINLEDRLCAETVAAEWLELVGSFIAGHSRPDTLKRGTLVVRVIQPTVRYALEGQKLQILQRLQHRFGNRKIRNLKFQIG